MRTKIKKGTINIALYKSDADFSQEKFSYVSKTPIDSSEIFIFDKIDYGYYGIAVSHDENENQKLDRILLECQQKAMDF